MSYLPRMSKTYKEPRALFSEELEDSKTSLYIEPASSLLNEKTYNPQMTLKHYKYLPHPPPVLPGPSVIEELMENELYRELSKNRKSTRNEQLTKVEQIELHSPTPDSNEATLERDISKDFPKQIKRSHSKKAIKGIKTSAGKKKYSKNSIERKKENASKTDYIINMCLTGSGIAKSFSAAQTERKYKEESEQSKSKNDLSFLNRGKCVTPLDSSDCPSESQSSPCNLKQLLPEVRKLEMKTKEVVHRSVQCTIFGSAEKVFVISPVINSLLRALAFLLHELNREESVSRSSGERKRLMTQIQLILGDMCNQKIEKEFGFDTTYSDSKRVEKILGDLQNYIKDFYGDKGEFIDKMEDLKKVFVELKNKEIELSFLTDKMEERERAKANEVNVKDSDFKHPEVTLQNKRLESEQLLAEIEFGRRELKSYQKALAEIDWDIKIFQEQTTSLKKSLVSRSKSEVLGRKASIQKFSHELLAKGSKTKEVQEFGGKRT